MPELHPRRRLAWLSRHLTLWRLPTSRVISVRLNDDDATRIDRVARRFGRTPGSTATLLLREKLREEEFANIEFRDSASGRHAYVKGHRLAVWQVVCLAREYEMNPERVAEHLQWPVDLVQSALKYAEAFPEEIDPIVEEVENMTFEDLRRKLPGLREFRV